MTADYDARIKEAQQHLDDVLAKMADLKEQFLSRTAEFLSEWFSSEAENQVTSDPDTTKAVGKAALRNIKQGVAALQDQASSIVAEFLTDSSIWWHESFGDHKYYMFSGRRPPSPFDNLVRLACGKLAPILEKHGYLKEGKSESGWREYDRTGNYHPPNARPYYPYGLDWTKDMCQALAAYDQLHSEGQTKLQEVNSLKDAKEKSEAKDLWRDA
jgi:hypothetical protein